MKVVKFGGTVLSTPEGFKSMTQIVSNGFRGVVVISALSNTTRKLDFIGRLAQKGLLNEASEAVEQLLADHRLLIKLVISSNSSRESLFETLQGIQDDLLRIVEAVSVTRQLTMRTLDQILASGESLALQIVTSALKCSGLKAASVDSTRLIITNENFGLAEPLVEKSRFSIQEFLRPALKVNDVVVVQGFVGSTEGGAVTTMGKESSNMTATFLGSMLGAEEIVIYTDVQGVRSADPHLCDGTIVRPQLSYLQASLLAEHGLKLLYPTMIQPAQKMNIPIRITSAMNPSGESTLISSKESEIGPVIIQSEVEGQRTDITAVFCDANSWLGAMISVLSENQADPLTDYKVDANSESGICTLQVESARQTALANSFHKKLCLQ